MAFNLQVSNKAELKEWSRVLHLLSKLGAVRETMKRERKDEDEKVVFQLAVEKLLRGFDRKAESSRTVLTRLAEAKWKAKVRLTELLNEMEKKSMELQNRYRNFKEQEKELREKMHRLNQMEFFLQQEVRRSNLLQQQVVPLFYRQGTNQEKMHRLNQME